MKEFFQYFYYRVYTWQCKLWGESNSPQTAAIGAISTMMFYNLITFAIILQGLGVVVLFDKEPTPKYYIIIIGIIIYSFNSSWIKRNGGYKQIAKIYKDESKSVRNKKLALIWIYICLSHIVPIALIMLIWW